MTTTISKLLYAAIPAWVLLVNVVGCGATPNENDGAIDASPGVDALPSRPDAPSPDADGAQAPGFDAPPPPPDAGSEPDADAAQPPPPDGPAVVDASVDVSSPRDAGPADVTADSPTVTPSDASLRDGPKPWPPPGTAYLTQLTTEAEFNQLAAAGRNEVLFIIRRRGDNVSYPYPWDAYECVFETGMLHLEFLQAIDRERALGLYLVDAKTLGGNLIPGRISFDRATGPKAMRVLIENVSGLAGPSVAVFALDPTVPRLIRERLARCVPFASTFQFNMQCNTASGFSSCPMP